VKNIELNIVDIRTDKAHRVTLSRREAYDLYRALNQLFGDAQSGAKPGELLVVPDARIAVSG
jgi:hypothetical protein